MVEPRDYNPEFLYLTTRGWKTGKPHEIEIWFVSYGSCSYLISGGGEKAHWVQNIQHNPDISFWVQGTVYKGTGHIINPVAEPVLAQSIAQLMQTKYKWNDGLIVELCPD